MQRKYRVVSLFSGAMGLDIGLDQTDRFELLAAVEVERSFCETISRNVQAGRISGSPVVLCRDIAELTVEELMNTIGVAPGEVDILVGGPPCQSFSTAGKRQSVQDPRGTLLWHFLRFIEGLQPKLFLMENVRGLTSAALKHRPIAKRPEKGGPALTPEEEQGSVIRLFADDLQKIVGGPYHMDCFEVNAVNYGAPQLRERALFIGNRFNMEIDFPSPTHGSQDAADTPDLFSRTELVPWRTLEDALSGLHGPGEVIMDFSPRKKRYLDMVPPGSNWRSLPEEVQRESMGKAHVAKGGRSGWWRRLSFDLPCPTLVTMPNHASTSLCHPTETRALSLREYARIQEFPDAWEFSGTPAQQYAQVGNAVPTRLGRIAGEVIATSLDKLASVGWTCQPRLSESFRVIYVQSHVRTRQWFKAGKTYVRDSLSEPNESNYSAPVVRKKVRNIGGSNG